VEVVVGIETDRGPWVTALITAGYLVFPVIPLQASRYRERHGVSGAKSDAGDGHMLADMVRTESHQLRPAAGDSPKAEGIKVLARDPVQAGSPQLEMTRRPQGGAKCHFCGTGQALPTRIVVGASCVPP